MLEGENVNLRIMEKEDLPLLLEWVNNPEFLGQYNPIRQISRREKENADEGGDPEEHRTFLIEKKDGAKIGFISYFYVVWDGVGKLLTIAYSLLPAERGKGYCTEAVKIIVDYLFLSREAPSIQATTHTENLPSQRVLEKAGFSREGVMRKRFYIRGEWEDQVLYSILKKEWKEPRVLTKKV